MPCLRGNRGAGSVVGGFHDARVHHGKIRFGTAQVVMSRGGKVLLPLEVRFR